ncbi:hypothetical protein BDZ97DRAFT_1767146 [Flammula alnicola]|nr:hypothetical protein BDZ97DRAFT_1767146 [Flammula alnicola]
MSLFWKRKYDAVYIYDMIGDAFLEERKKGEFYIKKKICYFLQRYQLGLTTASSELSRDQDPAVPRRRKGDRGRRGRDCSGSTSPGPSSSTLQNVILSSNQHPPSHQPTRSYVDAPVLHMKRYGDASQPRFVVRSTGEVAVKKQYREEESVDTQKGDEVEVRTRVLTEMRREGVWEMSRWESDGGQMTSGLVKAVGSMLATDIEGPFVERLNSIGSDTRRAGCAVQHRTRWQEASKNAFTSLRKQGSAHVQDEQDMVSE